MHEVLIVGCGNIAGGFDHDRPATDTPLTHAGAYQRHGDFALVACVEPHEERRAIFMRRWQVPLGFPSIDEALASGIRPTVVSICSPTSSHLADARSVLRMLPRVLFCEKPLTSTLDGSRALIADCAANGISLVVNYTRRWDPSVLRLAAELRADRWGAIRSVSCVYNKGINNNGSHMIDLLRFLLGDLRIYAVGRPINDYFAGDPSIPAILYAGDDIPVTLNIGHASDYSIFEIEITTEKALIRMEDGGFAWRIRLADASQNFSGYRSIVSEERHKGTLNKSTLAAVNEIDRILSRGGHSSSTGENALNTQAICEAIRVRALDFLAF